MPVDVIMSRISEIRSMVGIDPAPAPVPETKTEESATKFSTELSNAVAEGDTAQMTTLLNGVTNSAPEPEADLSSLIDENLPAGAAAVARGEIAATAAAEREEAPVAATEKVEKASSRTDSSSEGDAVVAEARKYLGVPYVWGGTSPTKGLDCSGLVQLVFRNLGVELPRVARQQAKEGVEISSLSKAKPGDLLGMRNGTHIAIYLGDNKILHSPRPGQEVSIRSLTKFDDIDTIRRVDLPGSSSNESASGARVAQAAAAVESAARRSAA